MSTPNKTPSTPAKEPSEWEIKKAEREAREAERKEREREAMIARWRQVEADTVNIRAEFNADILKGVCEAHEAEFEESYGMEKIYVEQAEPADYYYFRDNGSDILAVAHLDTVVDHARRMTSFAETTDGLVVHSGALDDRLGAYIILELLPMLGIKFDWLLTVGEESGCSTADFFTPPEGKEYLWMIEFDRGGTDVVMYQYHDAPTADLVRDCGARVGNGSFSDIAYLEDLEIKGFNWGVGYHDYHGPRGYAYLEDTFEMVAHFMEFHRTNGETYLPHDKKKKVSYSKWSGYGGGYYGSSYGSSRGKDSETTKAVEEWWRTKENSLYGEGGSAGDDELDEETQDILAAMDASFNADDFTDIDPDNPLNLDEPVDLDEVMDRRTGMAVSDVGGWPSDG